MKADLPLAVRRRMEEDRQREIRAALVRRHVTVIRERQAISVALFDHALNELPRVMAVLNGRATAGTVPTEPAAPAVTALPAPSADNLRSALGLT